ncbi:hypothetical protein C3L50_09210 [Flavobacterium alvei]|uniref:DUF1574 domain-containing protein n=1 Tax=Flavobacterium alvei TaxID=2080416 RepID=A0A2S5ABQ7_9FLAO|nr:hypothetical protein [Flavobacterium alvei]POY39995.1 hypothetical protein C3L50_09210 [Flavobacterium alvei]
MKKFIKQILLFLLPIVLISFYADNYISTNLKKSNSFAVKEYSTWNAIIDGQINSKIVIYGSSRAWVHINPKMIGDALNVSTYNLGIDGHNFWLQYLRHSLLLENNTNPQIIIFSLDVFTLQKVKDLYNSDQFLPYMLWNDKIRNATISYNGFKSIDYEIPLIRYFGRQNAIQTAFLVKKTNNEVERIKGYQGQDRQWNLDFDKAKKTMKNYERELDSSSIVLFEHFLNECKSKKIKLLFVYSPEYIEGQKFVKNRGVIISLYEKYSKKYDIPFYNYSNDPLSYQKKYFYNASHLNKTGAELFTKKLIDSLKKYYYPMPISEKNKHIVQRK